VNIPYRVFPDRFGGYLYSVSLEVSISLPDPGSPRTRQFEAIIDSGASRCVFHGDIGRLLGLDIRTGVCENAHGIGGLTDTYLHDISLHLPGGPVTVKAAFKDDLPVAALLGMNGFFEHHIVTFDSAELACNVERVRRS
jgi:hypothetical protein